MPRKKKDIQKLKIHRDEEIKNTMCFEKMLIDIIPAPIFYKDAKGFYLGGNKAFERYLGLSPEQFIGKTVYDISPMDLAEKYDLADRELLNNPGVQAYEASVVYADGTRHDVVFNKATITNAEGKVVGLMGVILDITERKRSEEELRAKEERHQAILSTAMDGIWVTNLQGRLLEVNETYCRMSGYSSQELLAMLIFDLEAAETIDDTAARINKIMTLGEDRFESRHRRKDGTLYDVELSVQYQPGEGGRLVCFIRDITERKKVETDLRLFRSLIDQSNELITVTDFEHFRFVDVNERACNALGYSREEFLTLSPADIDAGLNEGVRQSIDIALQESRPVVYEGFSRRKDGSTFPVEISMMMVRRDRNYVVVVARDITDRRRAEEALQRVHNELEQRVADRTKELTQVNEELRTEIAARKRAEETLQKTNLDLLAIIDNLPFLAWLKDTEGRFMAVNEPFARACCGSLSANDLVGKTDLDIWPKHLAEVYRADDLDVMRTRQKKAVEECIIDQGVEKCFETYKAPLFDVSGSVTGTTGIARDITERKQKEDQIKYHLDHLNALRDIDMAITGSRDLRITLKVILEKVTSQLTVDAALILLYDHHSLMLEYAAGRGFQTSALQHTRLRIGDGLAGRAAMEQRIITVNIPDNDAYMEQAPLLANEGFQMHIAVPLISKGHVKGVLEIFHRSLLTLNQEWMDFLETLATQTAIAIDNASLFTDLERSNIELMLAYDTTLEGWSRALDLRDRETEGHSQRVAEITVRLARTLGLPDNEIPHIRRGALLHDIGKMGIPDAILLKPGPLTEEEWKIMRKHPTYAYELLRPIKFLQLALYIPYHHHEKWDGTGYPRGLKSESIQIAARIFAVVDVWDALTSERPYRSAWPKEKALAHIKQEAGASFDPHVVEAFIELIQNT